MSVWEKGRRGRVPVMSGKGEGEERILSREEKTIARSLITSWREGRRDAGEGERRREGRNSLSVMRSGVMRGR